jgi:hypothetical protein
MTMFHPCQNRHSNFTRDKFSAYVPCIYFHCDFSNFIFSVLNLQRHMHSPCQPCGLFPICPSTSYVFYLGVPLVEVMGNKQVGFFHV